MLRKVADLVELEADGSRIRVRTDGFDLLVAKSEGQIYAIDNRCSHADMVMHKGRIRRCIVTCPSHLAQFDLRDGSVKRGPLEGDPDNVSEQRVFPVKIDGDVVFVDLPET